MITVHPTLYSQASTGKMLLWWMEEDASIGAHRSCSRTGEEGKLKETAWTACEGKNIGKANETSPSVQASLEINAKYTKKLKDHWHKDKADYQIKHYLEPMLAHKYDKDEKTMAKMWSENNYVITQPKLDGIRCIFNKDGAFSRKGEPFNTVPHLKAHLKPFFDANPDGVLDGELYNHEYKDNFEQLVSLIRKQDPDSMELRASAQNVQYHVYDLPSAASVTYLRRYGGLTEIFSKYIDHKQVQVVEHGMAESHTDVDENMAKYLGDGYEGLMVRLDKPYEIGKRSKSLLKYKKFITEEFKIVNIIEGKGNWSEYAKKVVVMLEDGTFCDAGIKGNFEHTKYLFDNRVSFVGKEVTIRYFGRTSDNKLRFGVAIDFHIDGRKD